MTQKRLVCILIIAFIMLQTVMAYGASTTSKYTGSSYDHAQIFDNMLILDGLDVSGWNENIDWNKVKADGIDFVIVRIAGRGYGPAGNMYHDGEFTKHFKGAKDAGLMVGGYFFSQAITTAEAIAEVQFVKDTLAAYKVNLSDFDLPIFMDREYNRGQGYRLEAAKLSKEAETAIELAFCDEVKKLGADAGVYANTTYLNNNTNAQELLNKGHTVWVAQYYSECQYTNTVYSIWQYASTGKVNGYSGNLDTNFWYFNKSLEASEGLSTDINSFTATSTNSIMLESPPGTEITLKSGETSLVKDRDYKVIGYLDNDKEGTAYAIVRGIGNYHGYRAIPFQVTVKGNLNSPTYKIDTYITGISVSTTVATASGNFTVEEGCSVKIVDKDGNDVSASSPVATGMKVAIYDDSNNALVRSYPIVVKADVNGDGVIKATDYMKIKNHIMSASQHLTNEYALAADVNGDGLIKATDYMKIKNHIMGVSQIS